MNVKLHSLHAHPENLKKVREEGLEVLSGRVTTMEKKIGRRVERKYYGELAASAERALRKRHHAIEESKKLIVSYLSLKYEKSTNT